MDPHKTIKVIPKTPLLEWGAEGYHVYLDADKDLWVNYGTCVKCNNDIWKILRSAVGEPIVPKFFITSRMLCAQCNYKFNNVSIPFLKEVLHFLE